MNRSDYEYFNHYFNNYVSRFLSADDSCLKNIILKKEHTERVIRDMEDIALSLKLGEEKIYLAKAIALFHDIGRFHQFITYKTYDDKISINHAELSKDIIESSGILKRLPSCEQEIIIKAVRYHNRFRIPADESHECMLFSKLVRDADKLDIYKVLTEHYENIENDPNPVLEHNFPQTGSYSKIILDDILNLRNSNNTYVKSRYDMRLLSLTWVFDVNFIRTLESILERGYIDKTLAALPVNDDMKKVRETLYKYIKDRMKPAVNP